jgi:PKD repeat protein
MKRICFIILLLGGFIFQLSAAHIRGGELYYKYEGPGAGLGTSVYTLTLKLYIDCGQNDPGQLDVQAVLSIFRKSDNSMVGVNPEIATMSKEEFIRYDPTSNPCITNPPLDVCYRLRYYTVRVTLPDLPDGYTIAFQRCCRIEGIKNVQAPSNDVGATYLCEIPGTGSLPDAPKNSSPSFNAQDAVAICVKSDFSFDFSADDPDKDSLVYSLCEGYVGGGPSNGQSCLSCPIPNPGAPPPYKQLFYQSPYSGSNPLGARVKLNSVTGILSGIAPSILGQYVVTVCVSEYRRGVLINVHRKDIHIKVSDCSPLRAVLDPDYSYCDDFNVIFKNEQINPTGSVYTWDFGDGTHVDTSRIPDGTLPHQYRDTGTYRVKMKVVLAGQCLDSTYTNAHVYPGFFPGFDINGACLFEPFIFTDSTKTKYGAVSVWSWDFGDETTTADSSHIHTPSWQYNSLGFKEVTLIVGSNKGCLDTIVQNVEVKDKPTLILPFKDTLICVPDSLQLHAIGRGTFAWTPNYNILNPTSADPIVYPGKTNSYYVSMTQDRCVASDTVQVRVVDHVTLFAGNDTTICRTDTIQLNPQSDGLRFTWTSAPLARFSNIDEKAPLTSPFGNSTDYHVVATIGSCSAADDINVFTVPYPLISAGPDSIVCFDDTASILGSTNGSSFYWTPVVYLIHPETLHPLAYPRETTTYTLYAFDTLGCPKPSIDQVMVTVRPEIVTYAGNDTSVVRGQPLQLNATGADFFTWEPETGLSRTSIPNPVAVLEQNATYIIRSFTAEGCFDYDTLNVRVFKTAPDIFVPNAFVPAGRNNELRPKPVGIAKLDYFRVFNRWGQLMFQTSQLEKGWDGRLNGNLQAAATYVWMVSGTDYTGRKVMRKGTAVLIR